ncbi:GNAT family N-acetyltransferase [Thalassotalea crassostreae]|uniref:GNAT family N-acetyltransferase n=1 Tax=Thalassotalea crassostreae TaxID=1763536 RepID=UPI0008A354AA|nr:GNAT family N-acetyltransferase [Thalassotalea crassostreae]
MCIELIEQSIDYKTLNLKIITNLDDFFSLQHQWQQLVVSAPQLSFSVYWEWLSLWWEIYANSDDQLYVVCCYKQQQLIAIAPFYLKNDSLYFIGTGEPEHEEVASEYLDIICAINDGEECAKVIAENINANTAIQHCYFYNFLASSTIAKFCDQVTLKFMKRKVVSGTRYLRSLNTPMKNSKTMLRYQKKFIQLNGQIKPTASLEELELHWQSLIELHQLRWQKNGKPGVFCEEKFIRFHQRFCKIALQKNYLELYVMIIDEKPIAAFYGFRNQQTVSFYQGGFDQTFSPNISPGKLLHFLLIEQFKKGNIAFYDFMKGSQKDSYKEQLCNQSESMYNATLHRKNAYNLLYTLKLLVIKLKEHYK